MRHAAALRIDHVLGLARLFWCPRAPAAPRAPTSPIPVDALLGELAAGKPARPLHVVGEDLGTVPAGLREALAAADILSYRVLWFERDGRGLRSAAANYPALSVACVSTHDLPPLEGWWRARTSPSGRRSACSMPPAPRRPHRTAAERAALLAMLPEAALGRGARRRLHALVAACPAALLLVQAEDLAGERWR